MEEFLVEFVEMGKAISIAEKSSIFQAAKELGIYKKDPCHKAEDCLRCKVKLIEGMVDYPSEPILDQTGENIVLACQAKILSPCKIAFVSSPQDINSPGLGKLNFSLVSGLFGKTQIQTGPDLFDSLEQQVIAQIKSPAIQFVECDYDLLRKAKGLANFFVSYACLPGRAKIIYLSERDFSFQIFCTVFGETTAELLLLEPENQKILFHEIKSISSLKPPALGDFLQKAISQYPSNYLVGGFFCGATKQTEQLLGLELLSRSTRPTSMEQIQIQGFPKAIVYPLQKGIEGTSPLLSATATYLKQNYKACILVDLSEGYVLSTSTEEILASECGNLFPEFSQSDSAPPQTSPFLFEDWLALLLKIYQTENSPNPRKWLKLVKSASFDEIQDDTYGKKRIQEILGSIAFSPDEVLATLKSWNWLWQVVLAFAQRINSPYELLITGKTNKEISLEELKQANLIETEAQWIASPTIKGLIPCAFGIEAFIKLEKEKILMLQPNEATMVQL